MGALGRVCRVGLPARQPPGFCVSRNHSRCSSEHPLMPLGAWPRMSASAESRAIVRQHSHEPGTMDAVDAPKQNETHELAGERETLTGVLEFHRETLARKCSGLTADQLRLRAVEPSRLSLIGLVRHLTDVELGWFTRILSGADTPFTYWEADAPDGNDFHVEDVDVKESLRLWHNTYARSREIADACESLDAFGVHEPTGDRFSLRWILTHMIQEYARHNGHADLLRERIDGQTDE